MAAVDVVSECFAALSRRDLEAMAGFWAPDGEEHLGPLTGDVRAARERAATA